MHKRPILGIAFSILLLAVPLLSLAQDAQPSVTPAPATATDIPVLDQDDDDSAAPSLPGLEPQPTTTGAEPEATAETTPAPDAETMPDPAAPSDDTTGSVPSQSVCPALVQESFTATEQICDPLAVGEACIGNGTVNATANANADVMFSAPGERTQIANLQELRLRTSGTENNTWTVVTSRPQLVSTDGNTPATARMVLFGDLTLSDDGEQTSSSGAQGATVIAGSGLNVRRSPGNDGVVVFQLTGGQEVVATGITADRQWVRIEIPSAYSGAGWVYAPYMEVEGGNEALPIVNANSPRPQVEAPDFGSMQAFSLLSAQTPDECAENPLDSGMLIQSPSGLPSAMRFRVNDVELQLNGTAFIQAQADSDLTISMLEGDITVIASDSDVAGSAGDRITVGLNANLEPTGTPQSSSFDRSTLLALPIRLLPRQFVLSSDDAAVAPADTSSTADRSTTEGSGFGTPAPTDPPAECTLTAADQERNLRSGPGIDYDAIGVLQPGNSLTGIGRNDDEFNYTWYQTSRGWIRFDTVQRTDACADLPVVDAPTLATPAATTTPESSVEGVTSSTLGQVCPGGSVSDSVTSDGSNLTVTLGGTLTAASGSTITVQTQGGMLRPEVGDYIRIVATDGTLLAGSDDGRVLTYTFQQDRTFQLQFSAANGDVVVMQVACGTPG